MRREERRRRLWVRSSAAAAAAAPPPADTSRHTPQTRRRHRCVPVTRHASRRVCGGCLRLSRALPSPPPPPTSAACVAATRRGQRAQVRPQALVQDAHHGLWQLPGPRAAHVRHEHVLLDEARQLCAAVHGETRRGARPLCAQPGWHGSRGQAHARPGRAVRRTHDRVARPGARMTGVTRKRTRQPASSPRATSPLPPPGATATRCAVRQPDCAHRHRLPHRLPPAAQEHGGREAARGVGNLHHRARWHAARSVLDPQSDGKDVRRHPVHCRAVLRARVVHGACARQRSSARSCASVGRVVGGSNRP